MPKRKLPLVTGEIYHVVTRGVAGMSIFEDEKDYQRGVMCLEYYCCKGLDLKFSRLASLSKDDRKKLWRGLGELEKWAEVLAFCLMPNHIHLLLRQLVDGGISELTRKSLNSYARFFNVSYERKGPLFEGRFRAVRVRSGEQLMHVSRYIHLNPYSAGLVRSMKELEEYKWSSLRNYLNMEEDFCNKTPVLDLFGNSADRYRKFVVDHANYQRELEKGKHLWLE